MIPALDAPTHVYQCRETKPATTILLWRAAYAMLLVSFVAAGSASGGELSALMTLGPIEIKLIDLAPNDGMAPTFRWTQNAWTNEIERQAYFNVGAVSSGIPRFDNPLRTSLAGDMVTTVSGQASYAKVLGNLQGLETFLSMAPGATPKDAFGNAQFNLPPTARYFYPNESGTGERSFFGSDYTFELSARTAVEFSSMASSTLRNTTGQLDKHYLLTTAFLHGGVLETTPPVGEPADSRWEPFVHDGSGIKGTGRSSFSLSNRQSTPESVDVTVNKPLSVRFDNAANAQAFGYFYARADAQIAAAAVEVPEPTTAVIAGFLLGMKTLQKRRRGLV